MNKSATIFRLSRPLFWMYTAGPFLIGITAGSASMIFLSQFSFWYTLFCFLIPTNIILYGINDLSDIDTDKYNEKKTTKEIKVSDHNTSIYKVAIIISVLLLLPLVTIYTTTNERILLLLFYFLSIFYSAPPLRFKKRPYIDSLSNILYIFPGLVGFVSITHTLPSISVIISASLWSISMHLFSAIPDIDSDKKAQLNTTAILLGEKVSLSVCFILWSSSVLLASVYSPLFLLGSIYPLLPLYLIVFGTKHIKAIYWAFPYITMGIGAALWLFFGSKLL